MGININLKETNTRGNLCSEIATTAYQRLKIKQKEQVKPRESQYLIIKRSSPETIGL